MFEFIFKLPVAIGSEMLTDGADETLTFQVAGQLGTLIHLKQGTNSLSRDGPRNVASIYMSLKNNYERNVDPWK